MGPSNVMVNEKDKFWIGIDSDIYCHFESENAVCNFARVQVNFVSGHHDQHWKVYNTNNVAGSYIYFEMVNGRNAYQVNHHIC